MPGVPSLGAPLEPYVIASIRAFTIARERLRYGMTGTDDAQRTFVKLDIAITTAPRTSTNSG